MAEEILLANIILIVFAVILAVICVLLTRQIMKSDRVARPFLYSLLIYFLFLCIANIQQIIYNFQHIATLSLPSEPLQIYTTFFVFLLTLAAPIFLIFKIENIYFPESKILSKIHVVTIINVVLFIAFIGYIGALASNDINIIVNFNFTDYIFLGGALLGFQVLFVILAFLYLGFKSSGNYRLYAILISLGWLLNYGANTIATLGTLDPTVILILLIPKLVGVVITALGLYRLYSIT